MKTLNHQTTLSTDEELIQKILAGEIALFEVLIRRYNPLLYKIARAYGLNHHDAEDIMQDTLFTVYTKLSSFRHEASFKTWLTRILLHKCFHKLNFGKLKYEESQVISESDVTIENPTMKSDSEKLLLNKELAGVMEESIRKLPMPYRTVFVLREMEGFSVAETAELLELTVTNVKVRLNRAKTMLQKELESFYSSSELFEFHLMYCDQIVKKVFDRIYNSSS
jgi:RNA polymerase sigma factor (sigma-70 family)